MKSRIMVFFSLAIALALLVSLAACGDSTPTTTAHGTTTAPGTTTPAAETPKYGGTLTVVYPYMGTSLGWPATSGGGYAMFQQFCLEPLLTQYMDGTIDYRLATGYELDAANKAVILNLRQGVKFHDGTPFNAEAVKFNFEAVIAEKKGASVNWESVEVINEYTVKVNYANWNTWVVADFSLSGNMFIVSPSAYEEHGLDWIKNNMVGTGPFKQVSWEQDVAVVFEKNEDYWDEGKPYVDKVEALCVVDPMTQQAMMLNNEADILNTEADKKVVDMQAKGLEAVTRPVGVINIFPDTANATSPLSKLQVREAIEYAINKEAIAQTLCGGLLSPAYQMAPPNVSAYVADLPGRKYDPEKARQLLADAGYPNGIKLTVIPCPVPMFNDTAVAIQADLKKVGIDADVQMITDAKFYEYVTGNWEQTMVVAAVSTCVPNWVQALSTFFHPDGILYPPMLRSDEFKEAFSAAAYSDEFDPAKAQALIRLMYEEQTAIPLFTAGEAWVYQSHVKDAWTNWPAGLWMWSPADTWLDK